MFVVPIVHAFPICLLNQRSQEPPQIRFDEGGWVRHVLVAPSVISVVCLAWCLTRADGFFRYFDGSTTMMTSCSVSTARSTTTVQEQLGSGSCTASCLCLPLGGEVPTRNAEYKLKLICLLERCCLEYSGLQEVFRNPFAHNNAPTQAILCSPRPFSRENNEHRVNAIPSGTTTYAL